MLYLVVYSARRGDSSSLAKAMISRLTTELPDPASSRGSLWQFIVYFVAYICLRVFVRVIMEERNRHRETGLVESANATHKSCAAGVFKIVCNTCIRPTRALL